MPRVVKPWEYSSYRATLRRNGKFFALVTPDGASSLTHRDELALMAALRSESVLKSVFDEISRRTGKPVTARTWRKALNAFALKSALNTQIDLSAVCLMGPDRKLYPEHLYSPEREELRLTENDVLFRAFETIAAVQGGNWRERYWKKSEPAIRAAKKAGWKVVPAAITVTH